MAKNVEGMYRLTIEAGIVNKIEMIDIHSDGHLIISSYEEKSKTSKIFISTAQFIINGGQWSYGSLTKGALYAIYSKDDIENV